MCINNATSIISTDRAYSLIEAHRQKEVDPALQRTADNSTMIAISAITIFASSLVVATVANFAVALWFALPLTSLLVLAMSVDSRIDDVEAWAEREFVPLKPKSTYTPVLPAYTPVQGVPMSTADQHAAPLTKV
jgi:hypothetical protein